MKRFVRLSFAAAALGVAFPAFAVSEYRWIGRANEAGASLSYAIPESDAIKLDFHCERSTKRILVSYEHEPKGAKEGMKITLRLSRKGGDASGSVSIPAAGQRLELDDKFLFEGETRMSPALRRILADEGTLLVSADGHVENIPLKGVSRAARPLIASCP